MIKFHVIKGTIRNQLYLAYMLSIFLPILVIGTYLVWNTHKLILDHHITNLQSDNLRIRSILLDTTTSINNISEDIATDPTLQKILSSTYTDWDEAHDALRNYKKFNDYIAKYTELSSITLYTTNASLHDYGYIKRPTETILAEPWYLKASEKFGYFWSTHSAVNQFKVPIIELRLTRKIPILGTNQYAILVINVSNNHIKSRVDTSELLTDISVNNDAIFYSSTDHKGKQVDFPLHYEDSYFTFSGKTTYFGSESLTEIIALEPVNSNDRLFIISLDPDAYANVRRIQMSTGSIVLLSIIVPFFMIFLFTRQFTNRVDTLRREMHRVSGGDYNIIETFKGNDELVELFQDLKIMIKSINMRDAEIYDAKISKQKLINHQQKMELEILASQINPHFLYNTLETIRMKAFSVNDLEVAEATKLLGKYMRHNLESSGNSATLKLELEYIEIYLKIQKLRFGDRIHYEIRVMPDIAPEKYGILPLLIQPVVENAIIHGLEEILENGQIIITVFMEPKPMLEPLAPALRNVVIRVQDNGIGMTPEVLNELNTKIQTPTLHMTSSIGLYNINQRIHLFYGNEYGLRIKSDLQAGTTIDLVLPQTFEWEV